MDLFNELLVAAGTTLYTVTSDTFRKKMGLDLILKDEDPDTYYDLIGVLKSKPYAFFEADHGKNIIVFDYKMKKTVHKIPLV